MYKLLIIDDEQEICMAIANLIDWKSLDVVVTGICVDSVEAYHMILDEGPDIILTDLHMPGLSGMELIERVTATDLHPQFIILSGYEEFDCATRAMKCGVRHYLLKPCSEDQIISCIKDVIRQIEAESGTVGSQSLKDLRSREMRKVLIQNLLWEELSLSSFDPTLFDRYHMADLIPEGNWQACFLYYLEEPFLSEAMSRIRSFWDGIETEVDFYPIYVRNVLILIHPSVPHKQKEMDLFLKTLSFKGESVTIEYARTVFSSFTLLLANLIPRLKRYDIVSVPSLSGLFLTHFNKWDAVAEAVGIIRRYPFSTRENAEKALSQLEPLLKDYSDMAHLAQIAYELLLTLIVECQSGTVPEALDQISLLSVCSDPEQLRNALMNCLRERCLPDDDTPGRYSPLIQKTIDYLHANYANENLTLKSISRNCLFMNESYVGKRFQKETGYRFSTYLGKLRIQETKKLLRSRRDLTIQEVAVMVGCGNNPYYLTKIFKKETGITPSAYLRQLGNESTTAQD